MTATGPRPDLPRTPIRGLAAMPAARLAPAAATLATAYAEEMSAGPPPENDRALAERHRAGRAALSHLRQLLRVLDRAAARRPGPAPAEETADEDAYDDGGGAVSRPDGALPGASPAACAGAEAGPLPKGESFPAEAAGSFPFSPLFAWPREEKGEDLPTTCGGGGQRVDSLMPEPATAYEPRACKT